MWQNIFNLFLTSGFKLILTAWTFGMKVCPFLYSTLVGFNAHSVWAMVRFQQGYSFLQLLSEQRWAEWLALSCKSHHATPYLLKLIKACECLLGKAGTGPTPLLGYFRPVLQRGSVSPRGSILRVLLHHRGLDWLANYISGWTGDRCCCDARWCNPHDQ
jgi:hypothetical protein